MPDHEHHVVTRAGNGVYRVETVDRTEIVYVAGPADDRWCFWKGHVFRLEQRQSTPRSAAPGGKDLPQALASPMPATVRSILVTPGAAVKSGDVLMVLEAMKMEL